MNEIFSTCFAKRLLFCKKIKCSCYWHGFAIIKDRIWCENTLENRENKRKRETQKISYTLWHSISREWNPLTIIFVSFEDVNTLYKCFPHRTNVVWIENLGLHRVKARILYSNILLLIFISKTLNEFHTKCTVINIVTCS